MTRTEILSWLKERREERLEELWSRADAVRREHVGDEVHLRGLIEISNYCVRHCAYCGIRAGNRRINRYRMTEAEIMDCVQRATNFGYGTVVLQSGEDRGITREWLAGIVRRIKTETALAVTLSVGERSNEDLAAWRNAGADRYLLRFETSNRALYDRIHPSLPGSKSDRIAILGTLRALGYETGSGIMIGTPGQTYEDLANDIELFRTLELDMIGVGPYIPHPETPLGQQRLVFDIPADEQAPNSELMTYKVIALTRIVCPFANIPSTTALATLNKATGREAGLLRGANVVMPNLTPTAYRALYEIYPGKSYGSERERGSHESLQERIRAIGRQIGTGRGDSRRRRAVPARNFA